MPDVFLSVFLSLPQTIDGSKLVINNKTIFAGILYFHNIDIQCIIYTVLKIYTYIDIFVSVFT